MKTVKEFKELSFDLKLLVDEFHHVDIKHSQFLQALSIGSGYKNYNDLLANASNDIIELGSNNLNLEKAVDYLKFSDTYYIIRNGLKGFWLTPEKHPEAPILWSYENGDINHEYQLSQPIVNEAISKKYEKIEYKYDEGLVQPESTLRGLNKLIEDTDGQFIDPIFLRHMVNARLNRADRALNDIYACYELSKNALPDGFDSHKDQINWGFINNRIFHRSYYVMADYLEYCSRATGTFKGETDKSTFNEMRDIYQFMLNVNPNDNQGIRFKLLEIYLHGDPKKVLNHLSNRKVFGDDHSETGEMACSRILAGCLLGDNNLDELILNAIKEDREYPLAICGMLGEKEEDKYSAYGDSTADLARKFYANTETLWNQFPEIKQTMMQMVMLENKGGVYEH